MNNSPDDLERLYEIADTVQKGQADVKTHGKTLELLEELADLVLSALEENSAWTITA